VQQPQSKHNTYTEQHKQVEPQQQAHLLRPPLTHRKDAGYTSCTQLTQLLLLLLLLAWICSPGRAAAAAAAGRCFHNPKQAGVYDAALLAACPWEAAV
jgi:hypothetical protein